MKVHENSCSAYLSSQTLNRDHHIEDNKKN